MRGWGPALRLARRSARRAPGRTILVAALIGLPVMTATWLGVTAATGNPTGELQARLTAGRSDGLLTVSPYGKVDAGQAAHGYADPSQGTEKVVRDTARFDPVPLLPPGTKVVRAFEETGTVTIRGKYADTSMPLTVGDGSTSLTDDTIRLDSGKFPAGPDEVAVSPALADTLGLTDGDRLRPDAGLTDAAGKRYRVVGIARTIWVPQSPRVFAAPGSALARPDATTPVRYLVDLPEGVNATSLVEPLAAKGLSLQARADIVDPPASPYSGSSGDLGPYAAMALVIGFGILEIVLLAGTAFAVGARRQSRELGLVLAAGGTPRDVRRIVLAQGVTAGVIGVISGLALAAVALIAGRPLWETLNSQLYVGWQVPWAGLAGIAVLGVLAGLAAAVVPAISAGRQAPIAALAGRFGRNTAKVRLNKVALALVVVGVGLVMIGNVGLARALAQAEKNTASASEYQATATSTGPISLVLLGITIVIAALVWMLPKLVALAATTAHRLPLSGRLALRDAARHRHRTGPATAAIMMAVAGTAAAAFAASNGIAADAKEYLPATRHGFGTISFYSTEGFGYSAANERRLAELLPTKAVYRIGSIDSPGVTPTPDGYVAPVTVTTARPVNERNSLSLTVVDPAYFAGLGAAGEKTAAQLRAGRIVVPGAAALDANGTVGLVGADPSASQLTEGSPPEKAIGRHPGAFAGELPRLMSVSDNALIGPRAAAQLGRVTIHQVDFEFTREPTEEELGAVARLIGNEDQFVVEKGYQSPARLFMLGVLGAATVFTLLGVAISVSLSTAEGRADLATLAAVGAQPRRRRGLAAAQAWVLGQLGCVLGVGVGALYGYPAHVASGSPRFVVPWVELAGIVLLIPLFAGGLAGLLTRSRLPMISRIE